MADDKESFFDRMKGVIKEVFSENTTSDGPVKRDEIPQDGEICYVHPQLLVVGFPQTQEQVQKYANFLNTHHAGSYLVLNLTKSKYNYSAFSDQVIEVWKPPYSHATLDMLFMVCHHVDGWLKAGLEEEKHVVVFHANPRHEGRLNMVVSCVLTYLGYVDNAKEAAERVLTIRGKKAQGLEMMPSHFRYINYFSDMLLHQMMRIPNSRPLRLVRVIMYPFPDTEEVPCVFEIVKDGQVVWESPELNAAGAELGAFKVVMVNHSLSGDVVFACKTKPPGAAARLLFRYAFHAGFTSPAPVRITAPKLDMPPDSLLEEDFFMDLVLDAPGAADNDGDDAMMDGSPLQAFRLIGRRGGHVTLKELEELERKEASRAADREKMTQRMSQKGLAEQAREKALERMQRKGLTPGGRSGGRLLSPTLSAVNDEGQKMNPSDDPLAVPAARKPSAFDYSCADALPRAPKGLLGKGLSGALKVAGAMRGATKSGKGKGKGKKGPPGRGKGGPAIDWDSFKANQQEAAQGAATGSGPKMRKMYWDTVDDSKISGESIFGDLQDVDLTSLQDEMGDMFGVKKKDKKESEVTLTNTNKNTKISLVGAERGRNVAIRISQFKTMGMVGLVKLLEDMDPDHTLSVEMLEALIRSSPTAEEQQLIGAFNGDRSKLTEVELFFIAMMGVNKLEGRLKTLRVSRLFQIEVDILEKQVGLVTGACKQVLKCPKLGGVFELVLALGNTLNAQKANGFRLNALLKLAETKSNKQEVTMLHYLASVIETRMKHLDGFHEEMPSVTGAVAVNCDSVVSCFQQLQGLVHDATVASGLVVPEVIEAISGQAEGEVMSPASMKNKVEGAGSAERFATELYINANGTLALLEEKCVGMIEGTAKLKQFFVEYELQVHEIFVILSTFFKAYGHVKKQNEQKRIQASKAEQFRSIKKGRKTASNTQCAGENVGAAAEALSSASRSDRWAAGSNGNKSLAVGNIAIGGPLRHVPSGAQTARPHASDPKPAPVESTQPKQRRNKPNPPPHERIVEEVKTKPELRHNTSTDEFHPCSRIIVEDAQKEETEAWGPIAEGEQF